MQTRHRDVADFSPCSAIILMPCKLDATERSMHILEMFSKDVFVDIVVIDPFLPLFAIMECHSMTQSCSTFAIKYFWQILNMICNFAKLIVVDPYMLCNCSCHG